MSSFHRPPTGGPGHVRQGSHPNKPTIVHRQPSISSESSQSSRATTSAHPSPSPYASRNAAAAASTGNLSIAVRPPRNVSFEQPPVRQDSLPTSQQQSDFQRQRARQHSQGFFEPSLPTASYSQSPGMGHLTASAIAAQAAMYSGGQHARKRSQTIPEQLNAPPSLGQRQWSNTSSVTLQSSGSESRGDSQTRSGLQLKTGSSAAATAASAAYPRSPGTSPVFDQGDFSETRTITDKDTKNNKEKSRIKIFSKPKNINTSGNKEAEKRNPPMPSPRPPGIYNASVAPQTANQSSTSLADPSMSSASSIYSTSNVSTSTLVPSDRSMIGGDKEKHRHHFLARQKAKFKDNVDNHLTLSSAASNSRPTDPNAQPLYSFTPASPALSTTFTKSKTGLDLRHAGRAYREKKREEKAAAGTFINTVVCAPSTTGESTPKERDQYAGYPSEWPGFASTGQTTPYSTNPNTTPQATDLGVYSQTLGLIGLPGMTPDDAWPLLKARLLSVFEREDIRTPIEDFNRLVVAYLQNCIQKRAPSVILEDLRELLETGFSSLDQTLRRIPDHRLVPHLVDIWTFVFGTILPFVQAVFHPLDLEFKGRGTILSPKEAADFWGALPLFASRSASETSASSGPHSSPPKNASSPTPLGDVLDIRTMVLLTFRDLIILPRHDMLLSVFSKLSLDSINAVPLDRLESPPPLRPGTATSSSSLVLPDPAGASFNSQGSTLLDSSAAGSLGARSRATSNTSARSAGSFQSLASQRPHAGSHGSSGGASRAPTQPEPILEAAPLIDSTTVTQTAAQMLQCVSVLASVQAPGTPSVAESDVDNEDSEIVARRKMEKLAKELKFNWLGRGRTGRNRRGFVGGKGRTPVVGVAA